VVGGNVYDILQGLVAIGREGRWVGMGLFTPPLYCAKLRIASKG